MRPDPKDVKKCVKLIAETLEMNSIPIQLGLTSMVMLICMQSNHVHEDVFEKFLKSMASLHLSMRKEHDLD